MADFRSMAGRRLGLVLSVIISVFTVIISSHYSAGNIDLTPHNNDSLYITCNMTDGRKGICVPDTECSTDFKFLPYGDIITSELRTLECGISIWCCAVEDFKKSNNVCVSIQKPNCPWCVALYRPGGSPIQRTESGLYCAGALVGKRTVLTAATCVRSVGEEKIWARVPASAEPTRKYNVDSKLQHYGYQTATHRNDFALMRLTEDVVWPDPAVPRGACLGLKTVIKGSCMVAGFDLDENFVMTPVIGSNGSCNARSAGGDAACGRFTSSGKCYANVGAPVVCPISSSKGDQVIVGVARQPCRDNAVKLGHLHMHAKWVREELARLGVQSHVYEMT